jgi:predicted AlkP superfamily pyrophosphatase or phosphodiesterase
MFALRRLSPALILVVLTAGLLAAASALPQAQPRPAPSANHVVVISLDGFGGWALDDPYLPVPTLRRLAAAGAVAKGMRPVDPTVTWANHTSMVTGVPPARHGVIYNGLLIREPGVPPRVEPWRDKSELVHARTLYDAAHERGLTTAQVDWVAIQNAPTITWEFPERPDPKGAIAQEAVRAGILSQPDLEAFQTKNILWRDHIWTQAAAHILRQHRPNLLLFHLLNLDSTQHRYGPRTPAAMGAMAHLDSQVAAILTTLEKSGLMARTTLFVVSDHGFKAVKRQIRPNVVLAKAGLISVEEGKVTGARVYSVPEGGTALVYVTVPDSSGALLQQARDALSGLEGIASVIEAGEFAKYGLPQPTATGQMGALLLTAKEGYAFTANLGDQPVVDAPAGSLGSHGYLANDPDLQALFIASGRGIKRGVTLDSVSNLDLAPTIARLLNLQMPDVQGKVLTGILSTPVSALPAKVKTAPR